jgi:hypothetical protein
MTLSFEVRLKGGIKYDDTAKVWVTYAPDLKLYSQGETEIQAKIALEDAVRSFICVAHRNGVLEKCLKTVGFSDNKEEYINIKEEKILEENNFKDIFDIYNSLPLLACA